MHNDNSQDAETTAATRLPTSPTEARTRRANALHYAEHHWAAQGPWQREGGVVLDPVQRLAIVGQIAEGHDADRDPADVATMVTEWLHERDVTRAYDGKLTERKVAKLVDHLWVTLDGGPRCTCGHP